MTPPDAAATARPNRGASRRRAATRPPRRVSGPAGGVRAARTAVPVPAGAAVPGSTTAAPPLALRLARAAARIGDARLLDRLVRGRGWIALVAVGLMGIVFVQVSMLRLNAGISRGITSAETLERQNSILRADISRLDAAERIADTAAAEGLIRPPAGDVNYLDARKANGAAAAKAIKPPQPVKVTTPPQASETAQAATPQQAAQTAAAPAQTATASGQTATAPAQTATAPAQTQAAPAQTAPAQTVPAQTVPPPTTTAASQTPAQTPAVAATATPEAP